MSVNITVSATDALGAIATATASATNATAAPVSIFTTQVPALVNQSDGATAQYELGVKFQSSLAGTIAAIRFWKGSGETSGHIGNIWSATGAKLATVTFANETASGWQMQNLATPLSITANATYVVSVGTSNTNYVCTNNGLAASIVSSPLSTIVGGNSVFGTRGTFPTQTFQASNYFRDVVFVAAPPPTVPPVITNSSFNIISPLVSGQVVGQMTATGSPNSWAITGGNNAGYFAIDNAGKITVI